MIRPGFIIPLASSRSIGSPSRSPQHWIVVSERQAVAMGYPDYETAPNSRQREVDLASGAVLNGPFLIGTLAGAVSLGHLTMNDRARVR
jgi:hypothetical protein